MLTNRVRAVLALFLVAGLAGVAGVALFSTGGVDANAEVSYNQRDMDADTTFEYEVVTYHRHGPLAAQIGGDTAIDVHPEHARLTGYVIVDSDENFSSSRSMVHDHNQSAWYTTEVDSQGNATVTHHRSGAVIQEVIDPSALLFGSGDAPKLDDMLEDLGWIRNGSGTFNGQPVDIYEIAYLAEDRDPVSGIELPYVEDLDPVSFKEQAMVSTTLNLVLKHDHWAVDADGEIVLIETMEIHKSKVE